MVSRGAVSGGAGGMRPSGLWVLLLLLGLAQVALLARGAAAEEDDDGGECGEAGSELAGRPGASPEARAGGPGAAQSPALRGAAGARLAGRGRRLPAGL